MFKTAFIKCMYLFCRATRSSSGMYNVQLGFEQQEQQKKNYSYATCFFYTNTKQQQ